jgi:thiosulfate/3-mercaptopyruvate sulfurtransferase
MLHRVLIAIALGLAWTSAAALEVPGPLVETGWLADNQGEVVVLDVRKDATSYLGAPPAPGKKSDLTKLSGHIPGAISVPWKKVVVKATEQGTTLKAMLPPPEAFAALMQASGVNKDSAVVIAGRGTTAKEQAFAARLYFSLKYFGHDNVALLDGGTAQWAKEGRPLAYTPESPAKGDYIVSEIREHLIAGTHDVDEAIESGEVQVLDCRTEDFYLGLNVVGKFVTPEYKGHIPGAKSLPFVLLGKNSAPAKLFSTQQMRDVAALKGVDLDAPTIFYCDTGVKCSLGWFALYELLGNERTRVYDGSMHAWSSLEPSRSVVALAQMTKEGVAETTERPATGSTLQTVAIRAPRSLQTLVEERRDALRRGRNDYFDAISGRRLYQPAWMAAREEMMDGYRDSMRATHRQHRDAMRLYRDTMRGVYAPWSRPYHD